MLSIQIGSKKHYFPATAEGLMALSKLEGSPNQVGFKPASIKEEHLVNFTAAIQKSFKHVLFVCGWPITENTRKRVWRQFWKNDIDLRRGTGGVPFREFLENFVSSNQKLVTLNKPLWVIEDGEILVKVRLISAKSAAAALGRMVNLFRWSEKWTAAAKLVTDSPLSWLTFNQMSLTTEFSLNKKKKK